MAKELKVRIPKGYEIDKENSTFECIKFKKKSLRYSDILSYYSHKYVYIPTLNSEFTTKISVIGQLIFVAKYLNNGWVPDFDDSNTYKYYLTIRYNELIIGSTIATNLSPVYFKTMDLAKQAIEILGEETIKEALSNDY